MKFFRPQNNDNTFSTSKVALFLFVAALIIGSFFLQIGMGLCPVPP